MAGRTARSPVLVLATALVAAGLLSGCGGNPDSNGSADGTIRNQGHNPASASDPRKPAPDDVISRRPGGPDSSGAGPANPKK